MPVPYFARSVEMPFAGRQQAYWAHPTDNEEVRTIPYGQQGLSLLNTAIGTAGLYYGIPSLLKKGHPANFWYDIARNVEELSPFKIFGTFRIGEAISPALRRTGQLNIDLTKLTSFQKQATGSYFQNVLGIKQRLAGFNTIRFDPTEGPFGRLSGIGPTGKKTTLSSRVRAMRPGRLFEAFTSIMQPGLFADVEVSRAVLGGRSTGWMPIPARGGLRDVVMGVRSYAAFSAQRLGELMYRVGEEISLPSAAGGSIRGFFQKVGLDLKPKRASFFRTLFGYGKFAGVVGGGMLGLSTLDALRNSYSPLSRTMGILGTTGAMGYAGSRIASSIGKAPGKGGLIGMGLSMLQLLPTFNAGLAPGVASVLPTMNLLRSRVGELTGMNSLRRWMETNFPLSTGLGTSILIGGLAGLGAYSYATRQVTKLPGATAGGLSGTLREIFPIVREHQLSGFPGVGLDWYSKMRLKASSMTPINRETVQRMIADLAKEAGGASKLYGGPQVHEAMEVASRIRSGFLDEAIRPVVAGGVVKREWQRLLASASVGRLAGMGRIAAMATGAWFTLTGGLGTAETPEELEKIYSGEQLVPVRRGRFWELGPSPYSGKDILYWRQHWYARLQAKARAEADSKNLPLDEWMLKNFTYQLERENYEERPYSITGAAFDQVPFIYPLIRPFTDLIKSPKLMHVPEWARIGEEGVELKYVESALTPSPVMEMGGLAPGAPVSPYSLEQQFRRFFYENTELAGLVGYATQSMYTSVTGAQFPFAEDQIMQSASEMGSLRRAFWSEQMGGAFMGVPFMSEVVRRFLPAYPAILQDYSPIRNALPSWLPEDLKYGDQYTNVRYGLGEERLPGRLYEELYNVGPEGYTLPHRLRILSDVAHWSPEYRHTANQARAYISLLEGRTADDMSQSLANLDQKRNKIDFDYYSSSGFGGYDSAGNIYDINQSTKERGAIGRTLGPV